MYESSVIVNSTINCKGPRHKCKHVSYINALLAFHIYRSALEFLLKMIDF